MTPWFPLIIFCWKGITFKSLPYEKLLCSTGCSPVTERFPENLFASSVFSLAKRKRRNEKESSFLKDLADIPKPGIFGFDSRSSRIVFLLHHLDKKLKMWNTLFFFVKEPKRTSGQRLYGWKWHFVVPNLSLSSRLLQATLPWLVSCCSSGPVTPCRRCFPSCCAADQPRAQPCQLWSLSPSPSLRLWQPLAVLQVTIPVWGAQSQLTGLQSQLKLLPVASGKDFFPVHNWLHTSWSCWRLSCRNGDGGTIAAPQSSAAEEPPLRGTVGLIDNELMIDFTKLVAGESKETKAELGHQMC